MNPEFGSKGNITNENLHKRIQKGKAYLSGCGKEWEEARLQLL
jgi:hypothetical protein